MKVRHLLILALLAVACRPSVNPDPEPGPGSEPADTTEAKVLPDLKVLTLEVPDFPDAEVTLGEENADILFPYGADVSGVRLDFTVPEGITADPESGSSFNLTKKGKIFLQREEDGAAAQFAVTSSFKEQTGVRGLFLPSPEHTSSFITYDNVCSSLDLMEELNFNTLFVCTWAATKTAWDSPLLLKETTYSSAAEGNMYSGYTGGSGDALKDIISEAHKRDIKVVLWFEYGFMHRVGGVDLTDPLLSKHPGWIGIDNKGGYSNYNGTDYYLNAYDPEVQGFFLSLIKEALELYPDLDGVMGDDRMPAMPINSGYDPVTKAAYAAANDGAEPSLNYNSTAWQNFRLRILNDFAADVYSTVKGIKPTAAVCYSPNNYPWCKNTLMQDWPTWVREGNADLICVQCYIPANYEDYVTLSLRYLKPSMFCPVMILKNGSNILSEADIKSEIAFNRKMLTAGESQFWFDGIFQRKELFKSLYPDKAINPL